MQKKKLLTALITILILAVLSFTGWYVGSRSAASTTKISKHTATVSKNRNNHNQDSFNKAKYSLTDPSSIWVIVNKQHPLQPISYIPPNLTVPSVPLLHPGEDNMQMQTITVTALQQMFAAAKAEGVNLEVASAYRSYTYQQSVYGGYVSSVGQGAADQESARPGYSEHQTGLAVDITGTNNVCTLSQCFGTTPEGEWLAANAYKYGFLLRYPQDKEAITGYEYEPWHFRYIGTSLTDEMHKDNIQTLEEFFGVSGGTTYAPTS